MDMVIDTAMVTGRHIMPILLMDTALIIHQLHTVMDIILMLIAVIPFTGEEDFITEAGGVGNEKDFALCVVYRHRETGAFFLSTNKTG